MTASSDPQPQPSIQHKQQQNLPPLLQLAIVFVFYAFHLVVLTQHQLTFPIQLVPNTRGHFVGIGYDSLAGMIAALLFWFVRRQKTSQQEHQQQFPWKLPRQLARFRLSTTLACIGLLQTYFWTGQVSVFWEDLLLEASYRGFFITEPMFRAMNVLLGHLSWVLLGLCWLRWLPRPPRFFQKKLLHKMEINDTLGDTSILQVVKKEQPMKRHKENVYYWFQKSWTSNWVWWVVGGYVSSHLGVCGVFWYICFCSSLLLNFLSWPKLFL
jgi:membrane protease YdiL (CAAX protease family)